MKTVILGELPPALASLVTERKTMGLDTHDEVWEGAYHMAPAANFEHGRAIVVLAEMLAPKARENDLVCSTEFNLGKPDDFRVPDLGVHAGTPSGVWIETAKIVVEVRSPDDETYDKFDFYFRHGVRELLVADTMSRRCWWYITTANGFARTDVSEILGLAGTELDVALGWSG